MTSLVIARNTFRETTRDRMLAGVVVAGLVLCRDPGPESARPRRGPALTVDLGLSAISLLGFLVVLLVGTSLVAKEIEHRSIYNLLSRPISRHGYLIGKWIGSLGGAVGGVRGARLRAVAVLLLRGWGGHGLAVLQAVYMAGLELSVVTAIAVLFSAVSTPVLSALYTLGIYLGGSGATTCAPSPTLSRSGSIACSRSFADLVPNLPLFNMRALAANAETHEPRGTW